jgi:hypothetical protein
VYVSRDRLEDFQRVQETKAEEGRAERHNKRT